MQAKDDHSIYNLNVALTEVQSKFTSIDVAEQCKRSGALFSPETVTLAYLNEIYKIDVASAEVAFVDSNQPVTMRDKILILHYITQAKDAPATGKQVTFRDLPGGMVYYPTFIKRTLKPLSDFFGNNPELLLKAGRLIGAREGATGDASLFIDVFAKTCITLILWQGDDELGSEVNLLFDANITDYLTSEDVTIACETITWRLINYAKKV